MRIQLSTGRVIDTSSLPSLQALCVPPEAAEAVEAIFCLSEDGAFEEEDRHTLLRTVALLLRLSWLGLDELKNEPEMSVFPANERWSAEDLFIVVAAFRHALPRGSYAPLLVANWIEARKHTLPAETRAQIVSEIREECARNDRVAVEGRTFLPIPYADRWLKLADALVASLEAEK